MNEKKPAEADNVRIFAVQDDMEWNAPSIHASEHNSESNSDTPEPNSVPENAIARIASRLSMRSRQSRLEVLPPPDGGVKAWTQVAMGWLAIFTTWGYINSFGAFQAYYETVLPYSASTISWIGSVQVFLSLFVGTFSGRLLDAGLFLPTFTVGAIIQLLGMFLMSISTKYWQLMVCQGILTGIGIGTFFTPSMALIATYFDKRRGIAIGIATVGNACGGIVYPILIRSLLGKIGFGWTTRTIAFVNLAFLAVILAFMRPRLPPRKTGSVIDWSAFREPVYVFFVSGVFFTMWALWYTFLYVGAFATNALGMPFSSASTFVILINAVGVPIRLLCPLFADRFGPLNTFVPVMACIAIVAWTWLGVSSPGGFYAWTAVYGSTTGAMQCILPTSVVSITKRLDMAGTRLGMAFSIFSFAALTGPPIGGALQSADGGSYTAASAWAASCSVIGVLLVTVAWYLQGGVDFKRKR